MQRRASPPTAVVRILDDVDLTGRCCDTLGTKQSSWGLVTMNNLKILQGLGAIIIAVSVVLSGCAAPEEQVPTEVTIEVTPD